MPCSAWRLNPTPMTYASRPRWKSSSACSTKASSSRQRSRSHGTREDSCSRRSSITKILLRLSRGADAALLCTEWDVFRTLDWVRAGKLMARKLVIDGRNLYSPEVMRELGFEYYSFGREALKSERTASSS